MRGKAPRTFAAGAAALALFAAGCSGDGDTGTSTGATGGELRIYATEPAFLTPMHADDDPSIQPLRQMFRGLVKPDEKTGSPVLDLAESITSDDNKLWTIKIKSGYKFDNGEAVNADAFIRAWNYTAYGPNAANNSAFMGRIAGIADVSSSDPDGDGPKKAPEPKAKELSGLKKVDDQTFTVELDKPFSGFQAVVGYSGFFPAADACIKDVKACNEKPITNGPYKMEKAWEHNVSINLVRSDSWTGEDRGKADKLTFKIFADVDAGYAAFQASEVDTMYTIPPARFKEAKAQYGDRLFEQAGDSFTYLGVPLYLEKFKKKELRYAFSHALDRQAIIDAVFDGRFSAATGLISPTFEGYRQSACTVCTLDVDKAKQLFDQAGGFQGKLTLWANAGNKHEDWLQAVGDQLKKNLGIDYELKVNLQFPEYLNTADQHKFTGLYRLGWGPDYRDMETYLKPLYGTGGSSNSTTYSNPEVDKFLAEGDAAKDIQAAIPSYQKAEDLILQDLPVIPMWFSKVAALYGEKVETFAYNPLSGVDYGKIAMKK
jgi:oligopeptide transport system substrate-binding protein